MEPVAVDNRVIDGKAFPLVLTPTDKGWSSDDFISWVRGNADALDGMVKDHGAVLFRDCPIDTPEVFARLIEEGLHVDNMPYVGGAAVRTCIVGDRVFTANESPSSEPIPFHHEMAQIPNPPLSIFFYCQVPPAEGGETPILLSHRVYDRVAAMHPEFAARLETDGVRYLRVMPAEDDPSSAIGRSWKSTFLVDNVADAEAKMRSVGTTWRWLPDGCLSTKTVALSAVRVERRSGRKTFFNSLVAAYTGWQDSRNDASRAVCWGGGDSDAWGGEEWMDAAVMADVVAIMKDELVAMKWHARDAIFIDNRTVMHSRNPFTPPRRILASIGGSYANGSK